MRVLLGAAVLAVAVPGAALSQTGERSIFASVVDSRGMPVTTLDAGDFVVREDGVNRTVIRVSRAEGPQRVALLVDTSQAMRPHLLDLRQALRTFVRASYGRREVALYEFGERPNKLVDYTQDLARLEAGVGRLFPRSGSGAYVLDAIAEVARELRQKETGHTAIVVVTAEGPEFSERYHQTVLGDLYKTRASLHSLVLTRALAAPLDTAAR
jgi:VWFA-related protein